MLDRDLWLSLAYCNTDIDQDHEDALHKLKALDCACMCLYSYCLRVLFS